MAKVPNDYELDFLKECSQEELAPLVGIILGTDKEGNIDRSGRISSELDELPEFISNFPDHTKYVDGIIEEIQKYGGNSIANLRRGYGVSYHEILCDVAKKMKVPHNRAQPSTKIEDSLLSVVLEKVWEQMSETDRKKVIKESANMAIGKVGGVGAGALIALFRASGFAGYKAALIIVNAVSKAILGHGLKLAGNVALVRGLAVLAGPLGWVLTGIWMAFDFAAPATRVTIPACIYIAALRKMKESMKEMTDEQKKEAGIL